LNQTSQSPLDSIRTQVETLFRDGRTDTQVSEIINNFPLLYNGNKTTPRSVARARRRWGYEPIKADTPYTKVQGDDAEFVTEPGRFNLGDIEGLLRERGLDPDDWEVTSLIIGEWGALLNIKDGEAVKNKSQKTNLKQLKVTLKRKKPFKIVVPARTQIDYSLIAAEPARFYDDEPYLAVVVSDHHAPRHDKNLHKLFLEWLMENQPEKGVILGDLIDLSEISRHPRDPEWATETQKCVDAAGQIILDYRTASPSTVWEYLDGNHEERLRRAIIDRIGDFYGLRPAQVEELPDLPPIHSPLHLLRLDELGVNYTPANGSYDHHYTKLSPYLTARHGWNARKGSGASAHATLDHLGHSVFIGHTHRQGMVEQTKHGVNGDLATIMAAEIGCMCLIPGGLGYAVAPDWQNGFATATIWPDGKFNPELAKYVDGNLLYADQRYS
jgi:hypothetical protein